MIRFTIDESSQVPPYEQLCQQVTAGVAAQTLQSGDRLPPVRTLASELGLAANTVAKAYRELEADGIVEGRGRTGTFIAARNQEYAARAAAARFVDTALSLGLGQQQALAVITREFQQRNSSGAANNTTSTS